MEVEWRNFMESIGGTILVGAIVLALVGLVIAKLIRDKRNGKSCQCGGDCSKCRGCH